MKKKGIFVAAAAAGGVWCLTKAIDSRLEVTNFNISSEKIPENFDGFKIVQLSDAHSEITAGLINAIEKEKPDLIVCTGDMTHDDGKSFAPTVHLIKKIIDIAPVYMVTGNHDVARSDFRELEKALSELGADFLHNERIILQRDDEYIALSGIDDPAVLNETTIQDRVKCAAKKLGKFDGYEILLFHRANLFELLDGYGFDLVLAGHMHGGQIRLPLIGGMVSPKTSILSDKMLRPKYFAGAYSYSDMTMLVSRGLGNPMILPRIFNRPELLSITLKTKKIGQ